MLRRSRWCRVGRGPALPWISILFLGLGACASCEPDAAPPEPGAPEPAAPTHGPYELHEWGFVTATMGFPGGRAISSPRSAPGFGFGTIEAGGGRGVVHGIGKPVLYFHLDEGTDALELSVGVSTAAGASIVEHFPPGELGEGAGTLRWPSVRVTRGACRGTYPSLTDPACQLPDRVCEAAEVPGYESSAADCVRVGERAGGVLLYRTGPINSPLPLQVEYAESQGAVRVSHADTNGSLAGRASGWVMRVTRGRERAATRVRIVPLGDESVLVDAPLGEGSLSADEGMARLREALAAGGLDEPEQQAFLGAWSDILFGALTPVSGEGTLGLGDGTLGGGTSGGGVGVSGGYAPPSRRRRLGRFGDMPGRLGQGASNAPEHPLGAVADALIYLLPERTVDTLLPLALEPAPRTQRRVFVARVTIPPRHVTLRFLPGEVTGGLSAEVVRRIFRRNVRELQACLPYDTAEGQLSVRLRVVTTGAVAQAALEGLDVGSEPRACLLEALQGFQFPAAEANTEAVQRITLAN